MHEQDAGSIRWLLVGGCIGGEQGLGVATENAERNVFEIERSTSGSCIVRLQRFQINDFIKSRLRDGHRLTLNETQKNQGTPYDMKTINVHHMIIVSMVMVILSPESGCCSQLFRFGCSSNRSDAVHITALSADGRVLCGNNANGDAIRWTPAEGFTIIGKPEGFPFSADVMGISEDGEEIFGYASTANNAPQFASFTWSRNTGFVLGQDEKILAIARGTYTNTCSQKIDSLEGYGHPVIRGISRDGKTLVGTVGRPTPTSYESLGFIWREEIGTTTIRNTNGVVFNVAGSINADGSVIVGGAHFPDRGNEAAIWRPGTSIQSIQQILEHNGVDLGTLRLYGAICVSDDGNVIVAIGNTPDCSYETCVVYLKESSDSDEDGISDEWELAYFGNTSVRAEDDPDGDGMDNLDEFSAGTNPSVTEIQPFSIDIECKTNVIIHVSTSSGWCYTLQYCDELTDGTWRDAVGQQRITGTGGPLNLVDALENEHRYYRVVAEPVVLKQ